MFNEDFKEVAQYFIKKIISWNSDVSALRNVHIFKEQHFFFPSPYITFPCTLSPIFVEKDYQEYFIILKFI